jgi:hypothetical protein
MRRPFRQRASPPNLEWSDVSDAQTTIAAGTKTLLFTLTPTVPIDSTIVRMRFNILIRSDQSTTPEDIVGAMGVIVVSNDAAAAGAASLPGPTSDVSADWFVYQPFCQRFSFTTAIGRTQNGTAGVQYAVDSKSKRILQGTDESLAFMIEPHSDSEGFITVQQGRMLSRVRGT